MIYGKAEKKSTGNREARRDQAREYMCHKTSRGELFRKKKVLGLGGGLEEGSGEGWIRTIQWRVYYCILTKNFNGKNQNLMMGSDSGL